MLVFESIETAIRWCCCFALLYRCGFAASVRGRVRHFEYTWLGFFAVA